MLQTIKSKLSEETVQRAVLGIGGMIATFVATQAFASLMNKGIETGIDALMAKLHPAIEVPTE